MCSFFLVNDTASNEIYTLSLHDALPIFKSDSKTELLIFLTPHIVGRPSELAALTSEERERSTIPNTISEEQLNRFLETSAAQTSKTEGKRRK